MNALSLLSRGYVCPVGTTVGNIVIGPGPKIVDKKELTPVIVRGKASDLPPC